MKKIVVLLISIVLAVFGMSVFSPATAASCPFGGSPNWKGECDTTTENGEEYFGPPMTEEEAKIYTENNSKPKTSEPSNANDSVATKCPFGGSPNWQGVCDTTTEDGKEYHAPTMTETQVQEHNQNNNYFPVVQNTSPNISNNTNYSEVMTNEIAQEIVMANPDTAHGYAIVDTNGNVLNVIVCSYNICVKNNSWLDNMISQGHFSYGSKIILQTLADKNTGSVEGYSNAKYDFENNLFIVNGSVCEGSFYNKVCNTDAIFKVPVSFPGSQELICIQNCNVLALKETEQNNSSTEENSNNSFEETIIPMMFSTKLKLNTLATVVATNKNKKKVWKTKVNKKGIIKINVAKKYKKWKFKVKVDTSRKFIRRN